MVAPLVSETVARATDENVVVLIDKPELVKRAQLALYAKANNYIVYQLQRKYSSRHHCAAIVIADVAVKFIVAKDK
ncbi:hypothetical protein M513_07468 [Trichuris suis]|uniref:Uncharacterized protein n=1 Tax=Trichuris suis TaxID=68888 RepID=A0A085M2Z3_9BILA|nr:hypothetical protein M513_07468 [Trichuris suis]